MIDKGHKNTAALASYFIGLCESPIFRENVLEPLQGKAESLEKILLETNDPIDLYRAQGGLKVIEDIFYWLGRHQDKFNRLNQEKNHARTREHR